MSQSTPASASQMFATGPPLTSTQVLEAQNESGGCAKSNQQTTQRRSSQMAEKEEQPKMKQRTAEPEPEKRKLSQEKQGCEENTQSSLESSKKETSTSRKKAFYGKYHQLELLGEGGFSYVHAGYRRNDELPVAIKHILKDRSNVNYTIIDNRLLPLEVAIMRKLSSGEVGSSTSIALLDFYDLDQELILVLERPVPAVDLFEYVEKSDGILKEEEIRLIIKQLIEAMRELQEKEVFHRDIKLENILIETSSDVPRVRLIDFGLSCFSKESTSFKNFCGTHAYISPESYSHNLYTAGPTTVWQIGVVLYELTHWNTSAFETSSFLSGQLPFSTNLSQGCQDMLHQCLTIEPGLRPSLEQLRLHPWLI